ncbi:ATP-binding protein [Streptomyces sp. NBC_01445]|uniref:ATP-binding protein n=1 Tax=Streptomyces sp. NBC_01445 TaxID=2903869 RepID=UPI002DDB9CE6|nr:ATP-binding protein [Streptomyces sp. NBC_01445]WSE10196.1 ATP-binding protein [Streptomyces sp. NBC_01445]
MHPSTGRTGAISAVRLAGSGQERDHDAFRVRQPAMESPLALPSPIAMSVERHPGQVATVRRIAAAWLRHDCRMPEERVHQTLIVISELVSNAVLYGTGLSVDYRSWAPAPGLIRIEVNDQTEAETPQPRRAGLLDESGRGLFLVGFVVSELNGDWGFTSGGTTAWCRLPVHPTDLGCTDVER